MNILLVEDSSDKTQRIREVIKGTESENRSIDLDTASSFMEAVKKLEAKFYDILILDILIPLRPEGQPDHKFADAILKEIMEGNCHRPLHLLSLSEYPDVSEFLSSLENRKLIHQIHYDVANPIWEETLADKISYLNKKSKRENTVIAVDVLVITASPPVELSAVCDLEGIGPAEYNPVDGVYYYAGEWPNSQSDNITVRCVAAPEMGMACACSVAMKAIYRWRPKFVVMCGIAAGVNREKYNYGDIIVGEIVYDYGSGKIKGDVSDYSFVPDPRQLRVDSHTSAILKKWEREQIGMQEIKELWTKDDQNPPRMHYGVIATGAAVVENRKLVESIVSNSRKTVGIDMEAYGVMCAVSNSPHPQPRVFVAKSVCDFADEDKDDSWQRYAAFTSSQFVRTFFVNERDIFC